MNSDLDLNFDLSIADVTSAILHEEVSSAFGLAYLADTTEAQGQETEIAGVLWGNCGRLLVPLVVCIHNTHKTVHFLIDSKAPATYLSREAIASFGALDTFSHHTMMDVTINTVPLKVMMSPPNGHFPDVNVLGTDFLDTAKVLLVVNYADGGQCQLTLQQ